MGAVMVVTHHVEASRVRLLQQPSSIPPYNSSIYSVFSEDDRHVRDQTRHIISSELYSNWKLLTPDEIAMEHLPLELLTISSPITRLLSLALAPVLLATILITLTYLYTTLRYRFVLPHHLPTTNDAGEVCPQPPPHIPYALPFLGSALSFLTTIPGGYWKALFASHPRPTGACTLLLGGKTTHILFSPSAVMQLFKSRGTSRMVFNVLVLENGFGMSKEEVRRFYGVDDSDHGTEHQQEKIWQDYLLKTEAVNELTGEFVGTLRHELKGELKESGVKEVGLYEWLREHMFKASTATFFGKRILEMNPRLGENFFVFDRHMLSMFFGIPKLLIPKAYASRKMVLDGMEGWHVKMMEECKNSPTDPETVKWEPVYGSRANRARQHFYAQRGLTMRGRAALDLGFLFGISSNAIPATGWMLMHILDPKADATLYRDIMEELKSAVNEDGTFNIPELMSLPLVQSIFHEVLRLYVDVLVTRELLEDLNLPVDDGGKRRIALKKGGIAMAPSWLVHRDESLWVDPPAGVFYPRRFLKVDPETGKHVFSTGGRTAGSFFPFGGGKSICPGRVFAKQEVLTSLALVLLEFEFEVLGYMEEGGGKRDRFPTLRHGYSGSAIMVMEGDVKVRMKSMHNN
jgi:Cytochrome P450